ncbi:MAG: hypothetical protein ABJK35_04890 [Balneola sp.]
MIPLRSLSLTSIINTIYLYIMKSFKSLFTLLAIASLSFACASVTDASLIEDTNEPTVQTNAPADAVFGTGNDSQPIITKPKM